MSVEKLVVVLRKTRLEEAIKRFNTRSQARFYVESRGLSFSDFELEHDNYQSAKEKLLSEIPRDYKVQLVDREFLPNFLFAEKDLIITLGQDGLVVNTAKYLDGQVIVAVNPDPERFDGILLPWLPSNVNLALSAIEKENYKSRQVTMAEARLNDGQKLYAFNDFFIGVNDHTSARYSIEFAGRNERQSSCGILVSTPAGSTGWMSSVYNMARGIAQAEGAGAGPEPEALQWEDEKLIFMVREPFRSRWSQADLVTGVIDTDEALKVESLMPEKGVIFSDGVLADFLSFNSGTVAEIGIASKRTHLVVP